MVKVMHMYKCTAGKDVRGYACSAGAAYSGSTMKTVQCTAFNKELNYGRTGATLSYGGATGCTAAGKHPEVPAPQPQSPHIRAHHWHLSRYVMMAGACCLGVRRTGEWHPHRRRDPAVRQQALRACGRRLLVGCLLGAGWGRGRELGTVSSLFSVSA
jgi:hypothetical protein